LEGKSAYTPIVIAFPGPDELEELERQEKNEMIARRFREIENREAEEALERELREIEGLEKDKPPAYDVMSIHRCIRRAKRKTPKAILDSLLKKICL